MTFERYPDEKRKKALESMGPKPSQADLERLSNNLGIPISTLRRWLRVSRKSQERVSGEPRMSQAGKSPPQENLGTPRTMSQEREEAISEILAVKPKASRHAREEENPDNQFVCSDCEAVIQLDPGEKITDINSCPACMEPFR